jgi:hypothetical protein
MIIECLPITGTDIKSGFDCSISGDLSGNSATLQHIGTPPDDFYVENVWTNGELFACFLFTIFLIIFLLKYIFEFVYPKVIKFRKNRL